MAPFRLQPDPTVSLAATSARRRSRLRGDTERAADVQQRPRVDQLCFVVSVLRDLSDEEEQVAAV